MTTATPDVEAALAKLRNNLNQSRAWRPTPTREIIRDKLLDAWLELAGPPEEPPGGWRSAR